MTDDAALTQHWLHWWQQAYWHQADESWHDNAFFALPADQQQALAWQQPEVVAQGFGIQSAPPAAPDARLITLIALSDEQWTRLLALLAGICAPQSGPPSLSAATLIWCRRLSKALRCESWLSPEQADSYPCGSLLLLRSLAPESWPRLRLRFPRNWTARVDAFAPVALPATRLAGLVDAALWQCQQLESSSYVDNPQDHLTE